MNEETFNELEKLRSEAELTEKGLKKKTFDLQTVSDVSQDMGSLEDTREILENLLMMVMGNLGALSGVILLLDTNKNKIETVIQRGMEDTSIDMLYRAIESGHFKELQRAVDVQIPGERNDARQKDEKKILDLLSSLKINIWIPFEVNEGLCGGIGLGERLSGTSYTKDDRELLCTLSNQGALAIRNIKSMQLKEKETALSKYLQETKEYQYSNVVGKCKKMQKLLQEVENLSKTNNPIIVVGESGTGKELIARNIHTDSARAKFPVIEFALPKERRISKERRKGEIHVLVERRQRDNIDRRQRDKVECELFGSENMSSSDDAGKKIGTFELADRGTIIIKNVENMPLSTQKRFMKFLETGNFSRVGSNDPVHSDVRVIVTTKDINLVQKQLDSELFSLLSAHKLEVPPLRDRKRDIPYLMEHFVEKISKTKHVQVKKFSKEATNKLLKYDYPGNVDELENVIGRAVELSKANAIIEEEVIFLGDTDVESKMRLNLLDIPLIKRLCESNKLIMTFKITVLLFFISLLYLIAIQPDVLIGGENIALILCWRIGLPLLFITFLFAARFGCGICPIYCISRFFNKYVSLKISVPSFIKKHDVWIMSIGFIFILFMESYTHMAHSVNKTAYLIFSILFAAIIADFIYEKSAWCRHFCPLGGLGSLFSMSSMIEIRTNKHTCSTICTTHDCFKGTEKVGPCPMFLHLQFLSDNRDCKICLNCIKSCTHNATRLNIRIPGAEISSLNQPSLAGALISIILSGLLVAEIFSKLDIGQVHFLYIFSISILFALSLNFINNYFASFMSKDTTIGNLKHFGYTLLPLTLFGHIALKFMEVFENMNGSFNLFGIYKLNYNLTTIIQLLLVVIGLFITQYLIYKVVQNRVIKNKQYRTFIIQGMVPLIFAVIYVSLFFKGTQTIVVYPVKFLFSIFITT